MLTRLESFTTEVSRSFKGILGSLEIVNPNPELATAESRAKVDSDVAVKSRSINFTAQEFTPESRTIPRRIEAQMADEAVWRDSERRTRTQDRLESVEQELAPLYKKWENWS